MNLPENWRLGRNQDNHRTLFYRDVWAERIPLDDNFQVAVETAIKNPNPRLYPSLYRDGVLNREQMISEQGVRNLVKEKLLTPAEAFEIVPSIKAWLKRNKLWEDPPKVKDNQVLVGDVLYEKKGRSWYIIDKSGGRVLVPKKAHFQSVWEARVAFARQEATLEQVAEYSWGAVFEVIGDQMQLLPDYKETTLSHFYNQITTQIQQLLNQETDISGFKESEVGVWKPIPRIEPLKNNPTKRKSFENLLERLLRCEISGYGARLRFNNAHPNIIHMEQRRWDSCSTVHIPYLVKRQEKIESFSSLEEARNYVRKHQIDMITIGFTPADCTVTAFDYRGNRYGLHLESGKIFSMVSEDSKYIPKDFDKWDQALQEQYLGEFVDLKDEYCKRVRACRKLYYYLKSCQGLSSRRAWDIATKKHRKLTSDFAKRKRAAARWNCEHTNGTATTVVILLPRFHWEVIK